jgi:apolipoprotein N-acyltransferase
VARLPGWIAAFGFPLAWTTYEFLASLVSPHGTALSLAYTQVSVLPVIQLASVTGIWGITFLVTLIPSAIATAWARRDAATLVPALVIGFTALGFGVGRLQEHPQAPEVRVGLAATDRGIGAAFRTGDPTLALNVAQAYADRVARLAAQGAQVVILPEKFVGVTPAGSDAIEKVFRDAARAAHVTVIAGFNRFSPTPPLNQAVVFGPDGRILLSYEKHHMLPGPETGYLAGAAPGLFPGPGAQWGVAICKDMDFPAWSREYGGRGVRILAVPAWDFVVDARLHSRMAVLRGVEEGFSIARSAQQGNLTFSDSYGRILGETSSSHAPEALLVATIPTGSGATIYQRLGDWFGLLCAFSLAAFAGRLLRRLPIVG